MKEKKIAILIACHNRKEKTLACLKVLFQSTLPDGYSLDVFLVDDGSTDGTAEAVKDKFPSIKIVLGSGELYWSRGMHLAWETAVQSMDHDYYLWLNDDTYIFQTTLSTMLSAADSTENKAIIVAASCSATTGQLTYCGDDSNGNLIIPDNKLIKIAIFSGNCVLIPKFVYQKVGNIDPLFHHAIGDNDYALRALKKGIDSFVAPGFLAHCETHDTLPKWCIPSVPFKERLLSLYSPLGHCHPYYFFRYELRHFGLLTALKHLFAINLRLLIPSLWK